MAVFPFPLPLFSPFLSFPFSLLIPCLPYHALLFLIRPPSPSSSPSISCLSFLIYFFTLTSPPAIYFLPCPPFLLSPFFRFLILLSFIRYSLSLYLSLFLFSSFTLLIITLFHLRPPPSRLSLPFSPFL